MAKRITKRTTKAELLVLIAKQGPKAVQRWRRQWLADKHGQSGESLFDQDED